jgi:branched-chain amino acid aminotransferase
MIDYAKRAWFDGNFVDLSDISVPINTYALHYGSSVYEGIRIYNAKAFKLELHIQRLIESADLLMMKLDFSHEEICSAIVRLIKENDLQEGYIRPIIWRGDGDLLIGSINKPRIAIIMWGRMSPFVVNIHDRKAQKMTIAKYTRYSESSYPVGAKAGGLYVSNTLSKYIAAEQGFDDAIMLTCDQKVAEATTANIFVAKNDILYTPTTRNILNGITRQLVIELASELGIKVVEVDFDLEFLYGVDEVFLTGTACEILPVKAINHVEYKVGEVTEKLYDAFMKIIRSN